MDIEVGSTVRVGNGKVEYEVIAVDPDGTPRLRSEKVRSWHLTPAETEKVKVTSTPVYPGAGVHLWTGTGCSCGWMPKASAEFPKKSWVSHRGAVASKARKAGGQS